MSSDQHMRAVLGSGEQSEGGMRSCVMKVPKPSGVERVGV